MLSIATASAQLTIPKEYLPEVHGTIRGKYEVQTTNGMQRFQVRNGVVSVAGQEQRATAQGSGPVDAAFKAIESIAHSEASLQLYSVNAITQGTDSQGEVTVRLEKGGRIVNGNGADTDILVASAKAYINALNLMQAGAPKAHPQAADV